jgi:ubiquinone biosynthesis protein COQ9
MSTIPERSPERDAALDALLARVPTHGWTMAALRLALTDLGGDRLDAELLFPGGAADMIEAFIDLADRRMVDGAGDLAGLRTPALVRALLAARFRQGREHREAIRRAAGVLALPRHAALGVRCTARTVDAIWHEAGDRSADFSWYTKRATLAAVYSATLLYWLRDQSDDGAPTLAFLDRRLAGVARVGTLRQRVQAGCARLVPARLRPRAAA